MRDEQNPEQVLDELPRSFDRIVARRISLDRAPLFTF